MSTASPGDAIDELLERDGLYANLWSVQVGEVETLPEEFVQRAVDRDDVVTD
jgi:ATP-binding cassette subfamily B protein